MRRPASLGRALVPFALLLLAVLAPSAPSAVHDSGRNLGAPVEDSAHAREYRIKAAFLYNFVRYTTWPAESFADDKAPLLLLIVGGDPFGAILDETFADKRLHSRVIEIRRSKVLPAEVGAHVVFAGQLPAPELKDLLQRSRGKPVLVVGESAGFAESGASGNFFIEDEKVRFEINVDSVDESRLQISSQLLKLARIVRDPEGTK